MEKTYYSVTETAKFIRKDLKSAFPGVKFSVRSSSYSGGASIRVYWIDGPTEAQVKDVTRRYVGSTFDGMIDLKSYIDYTDENGNRIHYGADHVFVERKNTLPACRLAVAAACKEWGWNPATFEIVPEYTGKNAEADCYTILLADRGWDDWLLRQVRNERLYAYDWTIIDGGPAALDALNQESK